jgi:hypothetical protein
VAAKAVRGQIDSDAYTVGHEITDAMCAEKVPETTVGFKQQ